MVILSPQSGDIITALQSMRFFGVRAANLHLLERIKQEPLKESLDIPINHQDNEYQFFL